MCLWNQSSRDYVTAVAELEHVLAECRGNCEDKAVAVALFDDIQHALTLIERSDLHTLCWFRGIALCGTSSKELSWIPCPTRHGGSPRILNAAKSLLRCVEKTLPQVVTVISDGCI